MRIGVLGTGVVGKTIGSRLVGLGHEVTMGSRTADNEAAIGCYAKVGFRPVGVMRRYERGPDGTWHDGLLMDLLADEFLD